MNSDETIRLKMQSQKHSQLISIVENTKEWPQSFIQAANREILNRGGLEAIKTKIQSGDDSSTITVFEREQLITAKENSSSIKSIVIVGIVIIVAIIFATNYQRIFKSVLPPKPVIVSTHADDLSSKLFDYSMRVMGEVQNKGGDGDVVIEVTAYQGDKHWTKTKNLHIGSYQTEKFEIVFDEVRFLNKDPKYSVQAYPLGSPIHN